MRVIARVFRNARNMLSLDQIDCANLSSQVFLGLKTRDNAYVLVERYHVWRSSFIVMRRGSD
jgi:hypothetical protein